MTWETTVALLLLGLLGFMGLDSSLKWFSRRGRRRLSMRIEKGLTNVLGSCSRSYVSQPCPSCGESVSDLVRFSDSGTTAEVS